MQLVWEKDKLHYKKGNVILESTDLAQSVFTWSQ